MGAFQRRCEINVTVDEVDGRAPAAWAAVADGVGDDADDADDDDDVAIGPALTTKPPRNEARAGMRNCFCSHDCALAAALAGGGDGAAPGTVAADETAAAVGNGHDACTVECSVTINVERPT